MKPEDWVTGEGYSCRIKTAADTERDQINAVQKLLGIKAQFSLNMPLKKIANKQILELGLLIPEEIKEVEAFEEQQVPQLPQLVAAAQAGGSEQSRLVRLPAFLSPHPSSSTTSTKRTSALSKRLVPVNHASLRGRQVQDSACLPATAQDPAGLE